MQIAKPQVHLKKEGLNTYHIHVVTWFDQTKFISDGYNSISATAVNGIFSAVLKVKEDSGRPNMRLLTPIVHTLTLEDVEFNNEEPFLDVIIINISDDNSEMGRRRTHQDDGDDSGMPSPKLVTHSSNK